MVIAIIAVLIALLLPAIQSAREAARRINCSSNLRQIGIALLDYEATNRRLPAAGSYGSLPGSVYYSFAHWRVDLKSGTNYSWVVSLLPYLGEQNLYNEFDLSLNVMRNERDPQARQPAPLLCPSDAAYGRLFEVATDDPDQPIRFGKANYAAFVNVYHVDSWHYPAAIRHYGQQMKDISDGTSSTLVFSEIRTRDSRLDQRGAWALPWSGTSLLAFDLHPTQRTTQSAHQNSAPVFTPSPNSLGFTQPPNSVQPDVLYQCPDLAGEQFDRMPCTDRFDGYISAAPRSNHPGGVNVVFLDGHVGFLPNDVDELAMVYMIHPTDGRENQVTY